MFDIEHTPLATTVAQAGKLIDAVITANHANLGTITTDITPFHSRAVPSISAHDYLFRVSKYVGLENDSVLAVLVYLDRITRTQIHRPSMAISPYNIHRLILSAIVVSHKFHSDIFLNNLRYSKVGGIPLAELNQLELELLFLIKFDLKVDSAELQHLGEWLVAWPGSLPNTTAFPTSGSNSVCMLSQYYEETAMARQTELYGQHLSSVSDSPVSPMVAPAADSLASTMTITSDADYSITRSVADNGANSAIPYMEMQQVSPNAVAENLIVHKRSFRRQHHPYQQQPTSHDRSPLELTTPSSMNTICAPATPPVFREHSGYEIDYGTVASHSEDVYNGIPATRSPHVAFAKQPRLHADGVRLSNGGDHQTWSTTNMVCQVPHVDQSRTNEPTLANSRRRRFQALVTMYPTSTAAATSGSSLAAKRPGMVDLTFAACNGDEN
ncbi:cyclin-like protein interacting with PHO85 [Coemansia sp. RSA 1813]|nr:cyclin-like protein interacting with PHO85 [Coemansia sp. RSA 1646]KAJ1772601.1 cyclin-like protein interacting with PHO85 [Coemansia sp. RSA 1843]KAJ2091457.1 cyclin-like protein interacting with PHO85 [Coemansia sp. RSA 986]KAJ2213879.1 cyclin-like protein interacting with PHO85 [Coemansia sp. RSA 487]KAJ2570673.1 cyclin-like protein interacting with PHO85 [Coemansia sp. RSA 1813]